MHTDKENKEQLLRDLDALRARNVHLEESLAANAHLETENQKLRADLSQRSKEADCFYHVLKIAEQSNSSLESILQKVVNLLPETLAYTETACARITYCKKVYTTSVFTETAWSESVAIRAHDTIVGGIELFFLKNILANSGFKRMLENIALILGKVCMRKETENALSAQAYTLNERIKELNCLLGISNLLTDPDCSLEKVFYKILGIVPLSWQYPEITCARIKYAGQEYTSPGFQTSQWQQAADIITAGVKNGLLEVFYREERPAAEEGPFLKEERHLLDALAIELGIIIEYKTAINQLFNYQKQLRSLASELSVSEEKERRRISAILHDCIGQNLFVSKVKLDVLKNMMPNVNLAETINEISMLMEHTIQTSRSLTYTIASPDLYSLGLKEAVQWMADKMLDQELTRVELSGTETGIVLHDDTKIFLYQAIRELLHNIRKHAAARQVKIDFKKEGDTLQVQITDNGRGFSGEPFSDEGVSNRGFGLLSIQERCRHLGGKLTITSGNSQGTDITLALPLTARTTSDTPTNNIIRILIADDHKLVLDTIRNSLEKEPGFKVVAVAESGRIALELALQLKPDVVVMDISMPDLNGIEATRQLTAKEPGIKIIALTIHADKQLVSQMLSVGARGYLLKDYNLEELIHAIRTVAANNTYLCPGITNIVTSEYLNFLTGSASSDTATQNTAAQLSSREHEILQLFAEGKSTKQIAAELHLSINTIDTHKWKIMKKLNIDTFAGLVKYAIRSGLTTLEN